MSADPSISLRQARGLRQPTRQPNGDSHGSESAEYSLVRQYRKRANEFLSKALDIDESGRGKFKGRPE